MVTKETVLQTLKCLPNQYPAILEEKYPQVLEKIVQLWNSPDGEAYLSDLLNTARSGGRFDRAGFTEEVWMEILRLNVLYKKSRPNSVR